MKESTNRRIVAMLNAERDRMEKILQEFDEMVWAKLGDTVTENDGKHSYKRPTTDRDYIDFIRDAWSEASERLFEEFGINTDKEDKQ